MGLQTGVVIQFKSRSTLFFIQMHCMAHHTNLTRCKRNNMNHIHLLFNCFCDYFVRNILGIFLKKSLNFFYSLKFSSYYFIKVYVKNLAKNVIFKKNHIHLQVLLLLKTNVIMFNECFFFFIHRINFKLIHMFP